MDLLPISVLPPFVPFQKIPRLSRDIVITEKIDGTNALVYVADDGSVHAGSRTRWITPDADNYGFAKWVAEHADELRELGPGRHYGEWWGQGIQRRYGLTEKRFSLFNVAKWDDPLVRPACCSVVPTLAIGSFDTYVILGALQDLRIGGSVAAPGYMSPEGIVIYHTASGHLYKKTLDNYAAKGQG